MSFIFQRPSPCVPNSKPQYTLLVLDDIVTIYVLFFLLFNVIKNCSETVWYRLPFLVSYDWSLTILYTFISLHIVQFCVFIRIISFSNFYTKVKTSSTDFYCNVRGATNTSLQSPCFLFFRILFFFFSLLIFEMPSDDKFILVFT